MADLRREPLTDKIISGLGLGIVVGNFVILELQSAQRMAGHLQRNSSGTCA